MANGQSYDLIDMAPCYHPRLVFPAVQENSSAVAILPHFLEVCGRKLDNCHGVQDTPKISRSVNDICRTYSVLQDILEFPQSNHSQEKLAKCGTAQATER